MKKPPLLADGDEPNLSWRTWPSGRRIAYFRYRRGGEDIITALGEIGRDMARRTVREKRRELGEAELLRRLGVGAASTGPVSKVAELLAAYDVYWKGTRNKDTTGPRNAARFLQIIEAVDAAKESPVSVWCEATVKRFEANRVREVRALAKAEGWDTQTTEERMTSAMRSVWGVFRQAKSLFADDALRSEAYRELVLPDGIEEVNKMDVGDKSMPQYVRPASSVIEAVVAGIRELRTERPALFLAAMLEVLMGARVSSGVEAKWSWFVDQGVTDIDTGRELVAFHIHVAKGGKSVIHVFKEDYALLLAARVGDGDFIIPAIEPARKRQSKKTPAERAREWRGMVFRELAAWLREQGLDRRQPNHELRKIFGDTVRKRHGLEAAADALGHSDQKLTKRHYTEAGSSAPVSLMDVLDPRRRAAS